MDAPGGMLTLAGLARRPDIEFGPVRISPSTRLVRGPAGEASLEPRAMQVLVALSDAVGAVVTRDALFRRCWGDAVVGDDSLNRAVADVRRDMRAAVGDLVAIQTVPRTGYRLILAGEAAPGPAPSAARRRLLLAGGGAAAIAAAGAAWWALRPDPARARAAALVDDAEQARQTGMSDGHVRAAQALEQAVRLDPASAAAWGKLALVRSALADETAPDRVAALTEQVQQAARRALALDPRQPDALAAGAILPPYFGDWQAAERRMDAVLKVAPSHVATRDARGFLYVSVGRVRENMAERLAIASREPLNAVLLYRLIYAHWIIGQVTEADRAAERALQLWPRHPGAWFARLWVLAFTGRAERALSHLDDAAARPDLPPWMMQTLRTAVTALITGRPADVTLAADRLLSEVGRSPSASVNALLILNGLGEVDRAFEVARAYLLEEGPLMASVRWRPGQVLVSDQRRRKTHMLFTPVAAAMRRDPRFPDLAERVGLAAYWRAVGRGPDGPDP
ncbi:winged helix-turn-helix domain-containing protein [uncultured Phenylobacterium sp.]|uniref:winged helix-turn-helix domain-containing protein n=1 Tax=uncultured Phenylobacterium sp. TaxID=349273 RepID=UPI0025E76DAF|nr:winged helix-turn-helix domain-containing protein [uncultured Phenylobacterium sp.]